MKKSYFLFILLSCVSCTTHAGDESEAREALEYAAAPDVVITESLYTAVLSQISALASTVQQNLKNLFESVVAKRTMSILQSDQVKTAIQSAVMRGVVGGAMGAAFATAPELYQEEPAIDWHTASTSFLTGFVSGAAATLGSYVLGKVKLDTSPFASAVTTGVTNYLLVPIGATSVV